jgi:hypothetical protein
MSEPLNNPVFNVDEIINECLDLENGGRPDDLRDLIRRSSAVDPEFETKLQKARGMMGRLHKLPATPDMTSDVLVEVDYLRPFLSPRKLRQVSATRVAVAAAAVITLSFVAFFQRMYPHGGNGQLPTNNVAASSAAPGESLNTIASAVNELRTPTPKPILKGKAHRWEGPLWDDSSLAMGDTSSYDGTSNWSTQLTLGTSHPRGLLLSGRTLEETMLARAEDVPGSPVLSLYTSGQPGYAPSSWAIRSPEPDAALLKLRSDPSDSWFGRADLGGLMSESGPNASNKATSHK